MSLYTFCLHRLRLAFNKAFQRFKNFCCDKKHNVVLTLLKPQNLLGLFHGLRIVHLNKCIHYIFINDINNKLTVLCSIFVTYLAGQ